ncbi:MAG TPA: aspartate:alanine exchanger family transporter [Roseiflexaceae bacterium]|nr:aspartate:alanine exchanger family transporter [Roseiflexaceae bacterium]
MIDILRENPLILLFTVAAIGYPLGRLRVGGSSLGVAAVLFVGLAVGALDPNLKVPEIVYQIGLVIFVYTIGLSSGRGFVASFRRKGLRDNALVGGVLVVAALLAAGLHAALGLRGTVTAGLFAGSLTNTPALAGVLEYVASTAPPAAREQLLADPVVGYSVAYPVGVVGMMLAIGLAQRRWRVDYAAEAERLREYGATNQRLQNQTVRVLRPEVCGASVQELGRTHGWRVIFSRIRHSNGDVALVGGNTRLAVGDLVSVIGAPEDVAPVVACLGEPAGEALEADRSRLDYRRIFVSNPAVAGRRLADLRLPERFGALVTRVRRGDIDLLPTADMVLEPGDRVRVVALRERMPEVTEFFGDSYRALSEVDILTVGLGLALGLLLGTVPVPLPGGMVFRLGLAGGPLVVALALGALERTGPLVWTLPYSANLTLRQVGLVIFLAGVGTRSGYAFATTFAASGGPLLFAAGAAITCTTALLLLWLGYRLLRVPMSLLIGMLAGLQTQPAVLGFALEQTRNDLPNIGYTEVYPLAMMLKILLAQVLVMVLR